MTADPFTIQPPEGALPAHSPLGFSGLDRYANCPGSVTLIHLFKGTEWHVDDDPDYRRDGVQAHELGANCLDNDVDAWEGADPEKITDLTAEMLGAVQVHLDYTRSRPGKRLVELKMHEPEFHPQAYSTLDCVCEDADNETVEIIDYKHGVGIVVEVEGNLQLQGYALLYLFKRAHILDHWKVRLTIVQPRAIHRGGEIRSWDTTAGEIRAWGQNFLRPVMEATADAEYLSLGEWCRFCPAKLVCPAYDGLAGKALNSHVDNISYAEAQQLKMLIKAVEERTMQRLLNGERAEDVGAKLVKKRTYRVFKGAAPVAQTFGDDAWEKKLKGPAAIEKLPGGKAFISEWAYQPESDGVSIAPLNDQRAETDRPRTPAEKYGSGPK